jgi:hypothetical protein
MTAMAGRKKSEAHWISGQSGGSEETDQQEKKKRKRKRKRKKRESERGSSRQFAN